jgi:putative intracellular protease/amidase
LRGGKSYTSPGDYSDELTVPLQELRAAGYEPIFATPDGAVATPDPFSRKPVFLGDDARALADAEAIIAHTPGLAHRRASPAIAAEGTPLVPSTV